MLFNSYIFIFAFLPITIIVFFGLSKWHLIKYARLWMVIASLFFYAYWKPEYLPLLVVSITCNYLIGHQIDRLKPRSIAAKSILLFGILINLSILGYYKYANFFVSSLNQLFQIDLPKTTVILPLAISFYTFTQIAYLVDAYRGETKEENYDFITYCLFVCFFPQLIAGPILRHNELIPQFHKLRNFIFSHKKASLGLTLFILGLSKKILIADNLSPWVASVFGNAEQVTFMEAWIGSLSYTLQLYFDFSGYSDMAIGLGWIVNIDLPVNFNSPYKSTSIIEFWRRWHITLSNFLRDYLYISLGGNRRGELRRYINLIITMLLGGLWHGAGWTFVLWGGLHGIFLVINQIWRNFKISLPKIIAWMITFLAVLISWVLFRAQSFHDAIVILSTMAGTNGIVLPIAYQNLLGWFPIKEWQGLPYVPNIGLRNSLIILTGLLSIVVWAPNTQQIMQRFKPTLLVTWFIGTLAVFCLLSLNRISEFLYFQF